MSHYISDVHIRVALPGVVTRFPRIDPILCICTAYLHWSIIGILLYLSFCIYTAGMQVDRLWMNAMSSALAQALLCYICDESMLCERVGGT